jgi:two-component system chemotaxis response regulator CheB
MADTALPQRDIVVIGASAGGISVLLALAAALPREVPASFLIVQHIGAHRSQLPQLLEARGPNPAVQPASGEPLRRGVLYVAPPDHHMLIERDHIVLNREAKENHARPAIDPLFRSAAVWQGSRVIGVVLSGRLDDGTAGLQAVKLCGGLAVVQDPADAEEPDMPTSALLNVDVDVRVPAAQLADTLLALIAQPAEPFRTPPPQLVREHRLSLGEGNPMEHLDAIGTRSRLVCPECSGILWEVSDTRPRRFRCHTGHAFTLRSLEACHAVGTDQAIWSALRALQEREALLRLMACDSRERGDPAEAARLEDEARHVGRHATQLQQFVVAS